MGLDDALDALAEIVVPKEFNVHFENLFETSQNVFRPVRILNERFCDKIR